MTLTICYQTNTMNQNDYFKPIRSRIVHLNTDVWTYALFISESEMLLLHSSVQSISLTWMHQFLVESWNCNFVSTNVAVKRLPDVTSCMLMFEADFLDATDQQCDPYVY